MLTRLASLALASLVLLMCITVVHADVIDFSLLPAAGDNPTIAYAGGANPLTGTGLTVEKIVSQGTPLNNGGTFQSPPMTMSFTTGAFLGAIPHGSSVRECYLREHSPAIPSIRGTCRSRIRSPVLPCSWEWEQP